MVTVLTHVIDSFNFNDGGFSEQRHIRLNLSEGWCANDPSHKDHLDAEGNLSTVPNPNNALRWGLVNVDDLQKGHKSEPQLEKNPDT